MIRRGIRGFFVVLLGLWALGCSSNQTIGDGGDGDDGTPNTDGPRLCANKDQCLQGEDCIDGVCKQVGNCSCNYDCDKARNEVCNRGNGKCEIGSPPSQCSNDCDCYTNETCSGTTCVPSGGDQQTCQQDSDCPDPAHQTCRNNRCVPKSCSTREDCAGATCLVCKNNECTAPPPVCQGLNDCCVGFHCNFGTCLPDQTGCRSDSDCLRCGFATANQCSDQSACQNDPDCQDTAYPRCNTDTGACQPECASDIDCKLPGQKCVDSHCVTPGCTPASCPQGQWCDAGDGQCKPGCDENADCTPPYTCNYSTHQCGQTDCCGGACSPEQYCDTATCTCADSCVTSISCVLMPCSTGTCDSTLKKCLVCPDTYVCHTDTGRCWCTAQTQCPNGMTCNTGTGQCEGGTTCNPPCEAGYNCVNGQCIPGGTGQDGDPCMSDADCSAGLLCNNSIFCIICMIFSTDFNPDFACRYECSVLGGGTCPVPDRKCTLSRFYGTSGALDPKGMCQAPF